MRDATRTFPRSLLRHLNSIPGTQNLEYAYRFIEPPLWQPLSIQSLSNSLLLQLNYGFQKLTAPGSSLSPGHLLRICVYVLSCSGRAWLFATPWTVAHQVPLPMEFSRQECWKELPFPSPGNLPNPGIEVTSPVLQGDCLSLHHLGSIKSVTISSIQLLQSLSPIC